MSATFLLGALLAVMILVRQMRWLVVIALLVVVGYFAHGRIDFWSLEGRQDHTIILRP
jgi:hypothetical protein